MFKSSHLLCGISDSAARLPAYIVARCRLSTERHWTEEEVGRGERLQLGQGLPRGDELHVLDDHWLLPVWPAGQVAMVTGSASLQARHLYDVTRAGMTSLMYCFSLLV